MSFTKQSPTKPGAYWWRLNAETDHIRCVREVFATQSGVLIERSSDLQPRDVGGEWEGPLVTAEEAQADAAAMREAMESFTGQCDCDNGHVCEHCARWSKAISTNAGRELLAELQRLRGEVQTERHLKGEWVKASAQWQEAAQKASTERDEAKTELQQLRNDLAKAQSQCAAKDTILQQFALLLPRCLDGVGGGTCVSPSLKVQMIKDARAALSPDCGRDYVHRSEVGRLRSEVEKAFHEAWQMAWDSPHGTLYDAWNNSRAREIATGELK